MTEEALNSRLNDFLNPLGFETHPFLVGWYNDKVGDKFRLSFPADTLAFVVLSRPSMFENTFVPFVSRSGKDSSDGGTRDPIDQCMLETFAKIKDVLKEHETVAMHDFELAPNRRPKILVQTAAHVSGAVRFFRAEDVEDQETLKQSVKSPKIYPVCLHPKFGGWFAIRGVVILEDVLSPTLKPQRVNLDLDDESIAKVLRLYNDQWQDWSFRDVIPSPEKYSELQRTYFSTPPAERAKVVQTMKSE